MTCPVHWLGYCWPPIFWSLADSLGRVEKEAYRLKHYGRSLNAAVICNSTHPEWSLFLQRLFVSGDLCDLLWRAESSGSEVGCALSPGVQKPCCCCFWESFWHNVDKPGLACWTKKHHTELASQMFPVEAWDRWGKLAKKSQAGNRPQRQPSELSPSCLSLGFLITQL